MKITSNNDKTASQSKTRSSEKKNSQPTSTEAAYMKLPETYRPKAGRSQRDPIDYEHHPYPSMKRFAELLVLRFNTPRTRHSYYRQMRLVHEFCTTDPEKMRNETKRW